MNPTVGYNGDSKLFLKIPLLVVYFLKQKLRVALRDMNDFL
jgi:hypothetical protein